MTEQPKTGQTIKQTELGDEQLDNAAGGETLYTLLNDIFSPPPPPKPTWSK